MNDVLAQKTIKNYVCAMCYGHLNLFFLDGDNVVRCANDECDGSGYVTKHYAERRKSDSMGEKMEVRNMMQDLGIVKNPEKGKTPEQLIKELGF